MLMIARVDDRPLLQLLGLENNNSDGRLTRTHQMSIKEQEPQLWIPTNTMQPHSTRTLRTINRNGTKAINTCSHLHIQASQSARGFPPCISRDLI